MNLNYITDHPKKGGFLLLFGSILQNQQYKNTPTKVEMFFICAQGGNRTRTALLPGDFKSPMSTCFITRAKY